jgi:hypothetical protein
MDVAGQKFGRLVVQSRAEPARRSNGRLRDRWTCLCECGNTVVVQWDNLRNGHTRSCGCLLSDQPNHVTHGMRGHRLYYTWACMKHRCLSPNDPRYKDYGGRGITICDAWRDSFAAFVSDMDGSYLDGCTLDRVDNSKGYCKENCKWSTSSEQQNNRRTNCRLTMGSETHTLAEWARKLGVPASRISTRLRRGWAVERALSPA